MIELIAGMERGHRNRSRESRKTQQLHSLDGEMTPSCQKMCKEFIKESRGFLKSPRSAKLIGPPAIHTHALNTANANQLHADVVAPVVLDRVANEFAGRGFEVPMPAKCRGNFFAHDRAVPPVGAKR